MERCVLINEIMWEYDLTKAQANELVDRYEKHEHYDDLCEFVKAKRNIAMIQNYV